MSVEPLAPSGGGGTGPDLYHQAYCMDCAHDWFDGTHPTAGDDYPGHWDLDNQNCIDWAKQHLAASPEHHVSMRQYVLPAQPAGLP